MPAQRTKTFQKTLFPFQKYRQLTTGDLKGLQTVAAAQSTHFESSPHCFPHLAMARLPPSKLTDKIITNSAINLQLPL